VPVPTHDPSCTTKAWPTKCNYCGGAIYFFSCSCGSKVFFDALGDPWPQHYCAGSHVHMLVSSGSHSARDVEALVEAEAVRRDVAVPASARALFRTPGYQETHAPTVLSLSPGGEPREFVGEVRGVTHVNFFKRLRVPDSAITRGLLGALVAEEHVEIVVRGPVNPQTGYCGQIEAFAPRKLLQGASVVQGTGVVVRVVAHSPTIDVRFWVVDRAKLAD
jgi:hypothetical protein